MAAATCVDCVAGRYQDLAQQIACKGCALGTYTATAGNTACNTRACPANAAGAPSYCFCQRSFYGRVHWNAATQDWDGSCDKMETGPRSDLVLVHNATCATGTISFGATTGTLYLSASKCVATTGICGVLPGQAPCSSTRPVVRTVALRNFASGAGTTASIQLHDDGVLSFSSPACASHKKASVASSTARDSGIVFDSAHSANSASIEIDSSDHVVFTSSQLLTEGTTGAANNPWSTCSISLSTP